MAGHLQTEESESDDPITSADSFKQEIERCPAQEIIY